MHQVLATLKKYFPNQRPHPAATDADWAAWLRAWRAPDLCRCGGAFVRRKGKRGPFEGCSRYPDCRSTRPARPIAPRSTTCPCCGVGTVDTLVSKSGKPYRQCNHCKNFASGRFTTDEEKASVAADDAAKKKNTARVKAKKNTARGLQPELELQLPVEDWTPAEWFGEGWDE